MLHHTEPAVQLLLAGTVATTGAAVAIAHPTTEQYTSTILWSIMPIAGALVSSGMAYALSSKDEPRRRIVGRSLGALLSGICGPRILIWWKPDLAELVQDPILLLACGSTFGLLGYALSSMMIHLAMTKAPSKLEQRYNRIFPDEFTDPPTTRTADHTISDLKQDISNNTHPTP